MKLLDIYLNTNTHKLNEANLKQLFTKTLNETPKLASRGDSLSSRVRYFGLSKDGTLNFKVGSQSQSGKFYYVFIEAPDIIKFADIVEEGDHFTVKNLPSLLSMKGFRVHCEDPSFLYYAFQYMATQGDYEIEPETRAPKRNNTLLQGGTCKHLHATIKNIYENQQIRQAIAQDIDNYLRMVVGLDYDDYQQMNHAKQIQQRNRSVKWKTKPSDYMNDYFARRAKNHQFLDDHDIKHSLKVEANKFIKANPNASVDDFLRSYFQMTQKAFADDMQIPEESVTDYFNELGFEKAREKGIIKQEQKISKDVPEDISNTSEPIMTNSGILTKDSEQLNESQSKKELLHDFIDQASKDDLWHMWYYLTNAGWYTEDKRRLRQFAHNVVENCYEDNPSDHYHEQQNKEIEIAICNATHKDRQEYFTEADYYPTEDEARKQYEDYLEGHIGNVQKAMDIIIKSCTDDKFIQDNQNQLINIAMDHDKSKRDDEEYVPYLHHFYPTNPDEDKRGEEFELACKHHILNNKHHWDYWIDHETLELPEIKEDDYEYKLYCVERVADWLAMAVQKDNGDKNYWYEQNRHVIKMPDWAFKFVDYIYSKVPDDYYLQMPFTGTRGRLDETENNITKTLYHLATSEITEFTGDYFGKNSLGGLTKGDGIYFVDNTKSAMSYYRPDKPCYLVKAHVACNTIITEKEYIKLLNDYDMKGYPDVWSSKTRRQIMLDNNIDACDDLPSEFVVFNLSCINVLSSEKVTDPGLYEAEDNAQFDIDRSDIYVHTQIDTHSNGYVPALGYGYYLYQINSVSSLNKPVEEGKNKYYTLTSSKFATTDNIDSPIEGIPDDLWEALAERTEGISAEGLKQLPSEQCLSKLAKVWGKDISKVMIAHGIDGIIMLDASDMYDENVQNETIVYNMSILNGIQPKELVH